MSALKLKTPIEGFYHIPDLASYLWDLQVLIYLSVLCLPESFLKILNETWTYNIKALTIYDLWSATRRQTIIRF